MNAIRPRIIFLDTGYKYSIAESYEEKLRLISQQCSGHVVTFGEVGEFRFDAFTVHSFPVLSSKAIMFFRALIVSLRLVRHARIAGEKIDLLVTYDPLNTGLLGVLTSWISKVPLLVELNGDLTDWSNYSNIKNKLWRTLKRRIYISIESFVLARANGVKVLYPGQLDMFRSRLRKDVLVRVFPNYLDLSAFRDLGETKKVAIVGFPFAVKGIDVAVAAFKLTAPNFPDWTMEILGWYAGTEKETLDTCIGGHPQIHHHAPISRGEMPRYIGSCGVVVCSSRTEGFPRVIKEAMWAGKPCIVSDVGGLPSIIKHRENGLLFRSENIADLAAQLSSLLSNELLRSQLGAEACKLAQREYTSSAYLRQFYDFANAIISASPPATTASGGRHR